MVHGLWGATNTKAVVKFLKENKFNAVRLPFSVDMAYQPSSDPGPQIDRDASDAPVPDAFRTKAAGGNPEAGMTAMDAYAHVIQEMGNAGIQVLVDQHGEPELDEGGVH